ncbi:MAG: hypothetical protein HRT77_09855 [Halioglobus sp.]|nr:hypothetical protein [Halioglobus sp.]
MVELDTVAVISMPEDTDEDGLLSAETWWQEALRKKKKEAHYAPSSHTELLPT